MRSEQEMMDLILTVAKGDDRIRAVFMNGSRANPDAPHDCLQDYDIVYVVTQVAPFVRNRAWLSAFGDIAVMQEPDDSALFDDRRDENEVYAYLMQFCDGNRIDLTVQQKEAALREYGRDTLTVPLLDKDGILPELAPPSDCGYRIAPPTQQMFSSCCNEFWWVALYVAKGVRRGDLLYAFDHLHECVRPMLRMMLRWQAGATHDWSVCAGKNDKYLYRYVPRPLWDAFLSSIGGARTDELWRSLDATCALMEETATRVARLLSLTYDAEEGRRARAYIAWVRGLKTLDAGGAL